MVRHGGRRLSRVVRHGGRRLSRVVRHGVGG